MILMSSHFRPELITTVTYYYKYNSLNRISVLWDVMPGQTSWALPPKLWYLSNRPCGGTALRIVISLSIAVRTSKPLYLMTETWDTSEDNTSASYHHIIALHFSLFQHKANVICSKHCITESVSGGLEVSQE